MTTPGYKIGRQADGLTSREREVLDMLTAGATHVEIAEALQVSRQRIGQVALSLVDKGAWQPTGAAAGNS